MTNYLPRPKVKQPSDQFTLFPEPALEEPEDEGWYELIHEPIKITISEPAVDEDCREYKSSGMKSRGK